MKSTALKAALLSALGLAVSKVGCFAGCGGLWEVPKDHFNGVNEFGYVSYWDKITEIDIGEDTPFPVVIGFQSDRETSSPYLGYGWVMPLLESYIVQTGENTFEIMKPTGYTSGFGRDPKNVSAIGGVQGWKGEIGTDTIKVWAPCGWSLSYIKGKLAEIGTPKGKRIVIQRDLAGIVENISMDGRILMKAIRGFGGKIEELEIEGERLGLGLVEKPQTQHVEGKNLIVGKTLSLGKIAYKKSGSQISYGYGLTQSLNPTMTFASHGRSDRAFTWAAGTNKILSDGEWIYNVEVSKELGEFAKIARSKGQATELWHLDSANGREVTKNAEEKMQVRTWFVSGLLAGKTREVQEIDGEKSRTIYRATYSEDGSQIREQLLDVERKHLGIEKLPEGLEHEISTFFKTQDKIHRTATFEMRLKRGEIISLEIGKDGAESLMLYDKSFQPIVRISGNKKIFSISLDVGTVSVLTIDNTPRLARLKKTDGTVSDISYSYTGNSTKIAVDGDEFAKISNGIAQRLEFIDKKILALKEFITVISNENKK